MVHNPCRYNPFTFRGKDVDRIVNCLEPFPGKGLLQCFYVAVSVNFFVVSDYSVKVYLLSGIGLVPLGMFRDLMFNTYDGFLQSLVENMLLAVLFLAGLWVWDEFGYSTASEVSKYSTG